MASFSSLFIFAVIGSGVGHAKSFVNVEGSSEVKGLYGQETVLRCTINTAGVVKKRVISGLWWSKSGEEKDVLSYNGETVKTQPGYSLSDPSFNESLDVSLLITNTTVEHEGKYRCVVFVSPSSGEKEITLNVTARYGAPTITYKQNKRTTGHHTGDVLQCNASGGYPTGQIHWFDDEQKNRTEEAKMRATKRDGGLFHLSSSFTVQEENASSSYTCAVFSSSGDKEEETTFVFAEDVKSPEPLLSPKTVTPVVVIGSLIVGLLLLQLIRRWRGQRRRQERQRRHDHVLRSEDRLSPDAWELNAEEQNIP